MNFQALTEGQNRLGLVELCNRFANEQWLPIDVSPELAAELVLDRFKKQLYQELELLNVVASSEKETVAE